MTQPFSPTFFRRLQQLKIRTRRAFLGSRQGTHVSLRKGHGLEFSDFRPYAAGDDFRYIDWGAYGRTDRLYVRQFREEQDLNVMVLLDLSNSMAYPAGENKYEMARDLALALGYIALTDGDSVTFSLLGRLNTPRYRGPSALHKAARDLHAAQPNGTFDFVIEVRAAIALHKIPGRCFVISDFLFESEKQFEAIDLLRAKNFEITVLQVLGQSELRLAFEDGDSLIDSETGEMLELSVNKTSQADYASQLTEHVQKLERYCFKAGIGHVLVSSAESLSDVLLTRLPELGILR